jgi:hypothetical protein
MDRIFDAQVVNATDRIFGPQAFSTSGATADIGGLFPAPAFQATVNVGDSEGDIFESYPAPTFAINASNTAAEREFPAIAWTLHVTTSVLADISSGFPAPLSGDPLAGCTGLSHGGFIASVGSMMVG